MRLFALSGTGEDDEKFAEDDLEREVVAEFLERRAD